MKLSIKGKLWYIDNDTYVALMQLVTRWWLRTTMPANGPTSNLGPLGKKAVIDVHSGSVQWVSSICSLLSARFHVNVTLVTQHLTHQFVKLWTLHIKMNNTKSSRKIEWTYPDRPLVVGYVIVIHTTSSENKNKKPKDSFISDISKYGFCFSCHQDVSSWVTF